MHILDKNGYEILVKTAKFRNTHINIKTVINITENAKGDNNLHLQIMVYSQ
jgi:hypothetical protein